MKPKASLPYSQELNILPYPEPQKCSSLPYILIYKICYNIILKFLFHFSEHNYILPISCTQICRY